jgi:hypothetical protein
MAVKCQKLGWDVTRDVLATIESGTRWIGDFELVVLSRVLSVPVLDLLPTNWHEIEQILLLNRGD